MFKKFWIKRSLIVFITVAVILGVIELIKGNAFLEAVKYGITWGFVTSVLYLGINYFRLKRGI